MGLEQLYHQKYLTGGEKQASESSHFRDCRQSQLSRDIIRTFSNYQYNPVDQKDLCCSEGMLETYIRLTNFLSIELKPQSDVSVPGYWVNTDVLGPKLLAEHVLDNSVSISVGFKDLLLKK